MVLPPDTGGKLYKLPMTFIVFATPTPTPGERGGGAKISYSYKLLILTTLNKIIILCAKSHEWTPLSTENGCYATQHAKAVFLGAGFLRSNWSKRLVRPYCRVWKGFFVTRDSVEIWARDSGIQRKSSRDSWILYRLWRGIFFICSPWFVISTDKIPWIPWSQRPHWLG